MPNENSGLHAARRNKKDEFYTQLTDIERELRHYRSHFQGKVVYCNCDDPYVSAFFEYFTKNFQYLGLKTLITTCYKSKRMDLFSQNDSSRALKLEYSGGAPNSLPSPSDIGVSQLKGDGDFRSKECVELLEEADIVVTNPPFSLFSEYVAHLVSHNRHFLIIGHQNAITYKEVFPLIREERMWLGYGFPGNVAHFIAPHYEDTASSGDHREGMIRVSGVVWFTNLDHSKRHEEMILVHRYHDAPGEYPRYDNYDAIEVSKTKHIPKDYSGAMGVPITYLTKHNPDQFEIIGATESEGAGFSAGLWRADSGVPQAVVDGSRVYKRLFIRHRHPVSLRP
jgi:hypothetical protein